MSPNCNHSLTPGLKQKLCHKPKKCSEILCIYLFGQDWPVAAQLGTFRPYLFRQMFLTLWDMNFESVPKKIGWYFYFAYTPTSIGSFIQQVLLARCHALTFLERKNLAREDTWLPFISWIFIKSTCHNVALLPIFYLRLW